MGGSSPPPVFNPPAKVDRSSQRNAWAEAQNSQRNTQANAFNTRVREFNTGLQGYLDDAARLRTDVSGLSIVDDERFGELANAISSRRSGLTGFDFNETQPDFPSVVNSGISDDFSGGSVNLNTPTLLRANTSARNTGLSDLQTALDALSTLRSERRGEETRVRDSLTGMRSNIGSLSSQLANMNLREFQAQRAGLAGQVGQLRSNISSFSSPILQEFMTQDRAGLDVDLAGLDATKRSLADRLSAEEARIGGFRSQLLGDATAQSQRLRDMTIADGAGINDAQAQLDALRARARGFSSELNADLSPATAELDAAASRLTGLQSQRQSELARIREAQSQLQNEAFNAQTMAGGLDTYNLNAINSLAQRIAQIRNQASGFQTPLQADFSGGLQTLDGVQTQLGTLQSQRQAAMDALVAQARGLTGGLGEIPLNNESAILDLRRRADGFRNQFGQFTGNDLAEERAAFDDVASQFDSRLQALSGRRGDIETRARTLLSNLNNGNFNDLTDIDPFAEQLNALRGEQTEFNATQALDELDLLSQRLGSERSRVQRDVANRTAAQNSEAQAAAAALIGGTSGLNVNQLTPEEIAILLSGGRRNRNLNTSNLPGVQTGSFSSLAGF
ncbi:hypothetical protein UFOVP706_2 [uncultured Caudovirales phage]|uniref:Uncharacterized protein n=1 Tax=uncultured Caudovirales phage TaxID=2100421 RepID=A0A6J5NMX8_9CAUD|nr:hypothetical protein UFOVP706_2 [uncultured Caudovirales phage]